MRQDQVQYGNTTDWISISLLAICVFTVTTTEMLPIGLLNLISSDLKTSSGTVGLAVTAYGLVAGLSAPFMVRATKACDRKKLLLGILAVFLVGNLVSGLAVNLEIFVSSRLFVGLIHGLLWSIVANIATRLATESDGVRATALAFSGISTALVLGVPLGTAVGAQLGWRQSFLLLSILSFVCIALVAVRMDRLPMQSKSGTDAQLKLRTNSKLMWALFSTLIVVIANYSAYTYVSPFLTEQTGISNSSLAGFLLFYGVAGVAGNFLAPPLIRMVNGEGNALLALVLVSTASYGLILVFSGFHAIVALILVAWGASYSAMPVILQTLVLQSSPEHSRDAASSVYVLIFNASIAAGALLGGQLIDRIGVPAPFAAALLISATSVGIIATIRNLL